MKKKVYLEKLGSGRHRIVFRRGNYVYKLPLNQDGLCANYDERTLFLREKKSGFVPYARCRMFGKILVMEYIKPERNYLTMPTWCAWVDCQQVGYDKSNRLVAYDYSY